jgi:coenzyme F420-reducing hydrogenase beta subunit
MHRIEETLQRDICIGCGACAIASGGKVLLTLGPTRMYTADLADAPEDAVRAASRVCPFSDESPNEDELGAPHAEADMPHDPHLGRFSSTFAGRVTDDTYLQGSSSGGLTSWLARRLVETGHADAVVHVGRTGAGDDSLFDYQLSKADGVTADRKSNYYAATMAEVLEIVLGTELRYVLIGVPCFIRAARALCVEDERLRDRLAFFVGLVCGHYKTRAFADSLAWQLGIPPSELAEVDFRVKRPGRPANDYDFAARSSRDGEWRSKPVRELVGGNWGHSAFQPEACNFCDDVVGETADVSFGDAWLPQFASDPRGTNIVVSRSSLIDSLFEEGQAAGEIEVFEASPEDVVASQAGGFRHRREGLAVRLADDAAAGLSVPRKRVSEHLADEVPPRRKEVLRQRRRMARLSHLAFAKAVATGDLEAYLKAHRGEARRYRRIDLTRRRRLVLWGKGLARRGLNFLTGLRKGEEKRWSR